MNAAAFLLALYVAGISTGCARKPLPGAQLASRISNADIEWNGNYFGLMPRIQGAASKELLAMGVSTRPVLVLALDDPERYAAAHVLLTQLEINQGKNFPLSSSHWNHLRVELFSNGRVRLHPEQREELKAMWLREFERGA